MQQTTFSTQQLQAKLASIGKWLSPESTQNGRPTLGEENGFVLVEVAFSLMVLFALTFGMIDLGRAVYAATVVQAAAQLGARAGLVDISAAVPAVQTKLVGLDPSKAQITANLVSNDRIEVAVNYEFEFITPYLTQLVADGTIKLTASASMLRF